MSYNGSSDVDVETHLIEDSVVNLGNSLHNVINQVDLSENSSTYEDENSRKPISCVKCLTSTGVFLKLIIELCLAVIAATYLIVLLTSKHSLELDADKLEEKYKELRGEYDKLIKFVNSINITVLEEKVIDLSNEVNTLSTNISNFETIFHNISYYGNLLIRVNNTLTNELSIIKHNLIPVGTIITYSNVSVPENWHMCDGSELSRKRYNVLFEVLGITFGKGDGNSTFNLPDIRGRSIIGIGQGTGLTNRYIGEMKGEESCKLNIQEMPVHNHISKWYTGSPNSHQGPAANFDGHAIPETTAPTTDAGGNSPHNNMQPYLALNWIIKVL